MTKDGSIVERLEHLRKFDWPKATDACVSGLTIGEGRAALYQLELKQATIERLTHELKAERDDRCGACKCMRALGYAPEP